MRPDLLAKLIDFIYLQLYTELTPKSDNAISYLARFVDFCTERTGIDIFSLNYDLCIEAALRNLAQRPFVNGFTCDGWHPEAFKDDSASIRLFKLHGSLDWVDDDAYGLCSFQFPRHKDAEDIEGQHRPLLIFGTTHKLSPREPFLSLAYQFSQSILSTSVLSIIGYSFGDIYINEIIEQGMRANTRLKIIVVSPTAEEHVHRIRLMRNSPRVEIMNRGARSALNEGWLLTRVRALLEEAIIEEPFKA